MPESRQEKYFLAMSLPLLVLLVAVSAVGLFTKNFYWRETSNWATQAIAQDAVDLFFISPVLLVTSILAYKNNFIATMIWGGTILFLIYTFGIYCFAVHFNPLFLPYCFIFGLSVYSFVYFLNVNLKMLPVFVFNKKLPWKFAAVYLIAVSVLFYLLWLSEIIPASFFGTTPKSFVDTGIFTNPVHVIDLSICLPGLFIVAVLLLKKKNAGVILTLPAILFCAEMSISIGVLIVFMKLRGLATDLTPLYFMGVIAAGGIWFFVNFILNRQPITS